MELEIKRFDAPDETRAFEKGSFEVVEIGGMTIGRARYEPGWKWSEHVGALTGTPTCEVEHLGMVVSGRAAVSMNDVRELVMEPGDVFAIPPGHDAEVTGSEACVMVDFGEFGDYAKRS